MFTQDPGNTTNAMQVVLNVINIFSRVMETTGIQIIKYTKVNGTMENVLDGEECTTLMEAFMRDSGLMINDMEMGCLDWVTWINICRDFSK